MVSNFIWICGTVNSIVEIIDASLGDVRVRTIYAAVVAADCVLEVISTASCGDFLGEFVFHAIRVKVHQNELATISVADSELGCVSNQRMGH